MRIGLIPFGNQKMPNLALMQLSSYHKAKGDAVILEDFLPSQVDKVYCSVLFTWDKREAEKLALLYSDIEFGGSGWDVNRKLPVEVATMRPDFGLYTVEHFYKKLKGIRSEEKRHEKSEMLVKAGIGFTHRGCSRQCPHCLVPKTEGGLSKAANLANIISPASNSLLLLNNNVTAQDDCLDLLAEIRERDLRVSITQGIDVRMVTPEIAMALSKIKLLGRQLHYSWDYAQHERTIFEGIDSLTEFVGAWKQMCYCLVGYNSSWEEDMFRFRKLTERGIDPYIMLYNKGEGLVDTKLRHFARWVNARIYKVCPRFEDYEPWKKARQGCEFEQPMLLVA